MPYDIIVEDLPVSQLSELRDGSISSGEFASLNGIANPVLKHIDAGLVFRGYFALDPDLNFVELIFESTDEQTVFSETGQLLFAATINVATTDRSSFNHYVSPDYKSTDDPAKYLVGEPDVIRVEAAEFAYSVGGPDEIRPTAERQSFNRSDIRKYEEDTTTPHRPFDVKGGAEAITSVIDEFAYTIKGSEISRVEAPKQAFTRTPPLWVYDGPRSETIKAVGETWADVEEEWAYTFGEEDSSWKTIEHEKYLFKSSEADYTEITDEEAVGVNIVEPQVVLSDIRRSFGYVTVVEKRFIGTKEEFLIGSDDMKFSTSTSKSALTIGSNQSDYSVVDDESAVSIGSNNGAYATAGEMAFILGRQEAIRASLAKSAISIDTITLLYSDGGYAPITYKVAEVKYTSNAAASVMISGDNLRWVNGIAGAITGADAKFSIDNMGSFTLDGVLDSLQNQYSPIEWSVIDHLGTFDWKFLSAVNQIPESLQEGDVVTRVFTEHTDSVFDPSAFSETIKDDFDRIESIEYFTDYDHNFTRYRIEFTYVGNSGLLSNSVTRHYDTTGVNTHIIEETYVQDLQGVTIANSYLITELVASPIALSYSGDDLPGFGENTLLEGQSRIWYDPNGVYGEDELAYHVTLQGGNYKVVEMANV